MTRVKICGITRAEDAAVCDELGADFLGFIFVRESPRFIQAEKAADIVQMIRPSSALRAPSPRKRGEGGPEQSEGPGEGPCFVGVFRDASVEEIERVSKLVKLDVVQLHGSEGDDVIERITLPVIKAFQIGQAGVPVLHLETRAEWVMFDTGGGTGRAFDWTLLRGYEGKPFFLAGGITPENVAAAIGTGPYAIDVASGVESAPGVKDHVKVRELFRKVRLES